MDLQSRVFIYMGEVPCGAKQKQGQEEKKNLLGREASQLSGRVLGKGSFEEVKEHACIVPADDNERAARSKACDWLLGCQCSKQGYGLGAQCCGESGHCSWQLFPR